MTLVLPSPTSLDASHGAITPDVGAWPRLGVLEGVYTPESPLRPFQLDAMAEFWCGDIREVCRALPAHYLQTLAFSPPYYGLRRYKAPPCIWGGIPTCAHVWGPLLAAATSPSTNAGLNPSIARDAATVRELDLGRFCTNLDCGAWEGHLGNEPTPQMFVDHLMEIITGLLRVLRRDGTLWMVIGDSYAGSGRGPSGATSMIDHSNRQGFADVARELRKWRTHPGWWGAADKCLLMIPHRVAIAMASAGWIVRNDIVWSKPNPTPAPIDDRCITAHEYIFLAAPTASKGSYFFDHVAIQEPSASGKGMRNRRSVWTINTAPADARSEHYATYPVDLAEPMVLASTSPAGACPRCMAPYARRTFREQAPAIVKRAYARRSAGHATNKSLGGSIHQRWLDDHPLRTVGWRPTCRCGCPVPTLDTKKPRCGARYKQLHPPTTRPEPGDDGELHEVVVGPAEMRFDCTHSYRDILDQLVPSRVGDLFGGSGTTLAAALRHARYGVYNDLSERYAEDATGRADRTQPGLPLFEDTPEKYPEDVLSWALPSVERQGALPLFD